MNLQKLRTYALPIAMIAGVVFHSIAGSLAFLTPYLLFAMLLVSYCKLDVTTLRVSPMYAWLLAIQLIFSWVVYGVVAIFNPIVAQGAFICLFCPTATSAPVIASLLGGNLSLLVGYSLVCNMAVALLAPIFFSFIGSHTELMFLDSVLIICKQVLPLLLLPLLLAVAMQRFFPRLHSAVRSRPNISFYLWIVALFIVVGRSVGFVMQQPLSYLPVEIALALIALICCIVQFVLGRKIGGRYGDKVSGAQGLGQKNTVLAIWLALTYLHPIASIAPASYVIWQNIINSAQLMYHERRTNKYNL
ncbi:MAG: transporter [Bacteroidaceae bacterium]|nr:transporter [Bacteroidaceae bacterium]